MEDPTKLADAVLLETLDRSAAEERGKTPFFIACLGVADSRRLPEKQGYSSTFDYCVRRLKLSADEAYRRITAARAASARPELLSSLSSGKITLSTVSKVAPHIRRPDASEIISRVEGRTYREVEAILAPLQPSLPKRDVVRSVAVIIKAPDDGAPPTIEPRVDFSFRGTRALRAAIERAKDILAHKVPFGELSDVLSLIVNDWLDRNDPQRTVVLGRLAPAPGSSKVPAASRREVWRRDGGRCAFIGPDGVRCGTRRALEIDHVLPRAAGGSNDAGNLRLLCRAHNDTERRRLLGEGKLSPNSSRDEFGDKSKRV